MPTSISGAPPNPADWSRFTSRWLLNQVYIYSALFGGICLILVPVFGRYFFVLEPAIQSKMTWYGFYGFIPIIAGTALLLRYLNRHARRFLDLFQAGQPVPADLLDKCGLMLERIGFIVIGLALGAASSSIAIGFLLDRYLAPPGVSNTPLILTSGIFIASFLSLACYVSVLRISSRIHMLVVSLRPQTRLRRMPMRVKVAWLGFVLIFMPLFLVSSLMYQNERKEHGLTQVETARTHVWQAAQLWTSQTPEAIQNLLGLPAGSELGMQPDVPAQIEQNRAAWTSDVGLPFGRDYSAGTLATCIPQDAQFLCLTQPWQEDSEFLASQRRTLWVIAGATLVFAAFMTVLVSGNIVGAVREVKKSTDRLTHGSGYLTGDVHFTADDEIADIIESFNRLLSVVRDERSRGTVLIDNIHGSVTQLVGDSGEIAAVTRDQVTGVTEQATSIEETATTAAEVAAVTKQIAEHIIQVGVMATETLEACRAGARHIGEALNGITYADGRVGELRDRIQQLAQRSEAIGDILTLIADISDRSELLSLNASLEAAGVGAHGTRFRVVADEMKRLAAQTREAAGQIGDIVAGLRSGLGTIVEMSQEGIESVRGSVQQVSITRDALTNISSLADETSTAARAIQGSTAQLSEAAAQMADTLTEISMVAQDIRSGADKVSRITEGLGTLTDRLAGLLSAEARMHSRDVPE